MTKSRSSATNDFEKSRERSSDASRFIDDCMNDRQGRWTRLEYTDHSIIVHPTRAYLRGYWVGMGFCLCLACMFVASAIRILDYPWSLLASLGILILAALKIRRQFLQCQERMSTPFLMICDELPCKDVAEGCEVVMKRDIACVRLRASSSTCSDDCPLWQTYLHLKEEDRGILIHQTIRWGRVPNSGVASDLARRLDVPLLGD